MSGTPLPDPAFLHNVPTSISPLLTSSSSTASTTLSSLIASITSTPIPGPAPIPIASSISVYPYSPSTALALALSVLYAILIPYHSYHSIYAPLIIKSVSQKHRYTIPLFAACVCSTVGYSLRIASVASESTRSSVSLYTASLSWTVISPIFVCAALYLQVTYLIKLCLPDGSGRVFLGIKPQWLAKAFISSDVIGLLCQGSGSVIAGSNNWTGRQKDIGTATLIFGLFAQLITFTVYLAILTLFCLRVRSGKAEEKKADVQVVGIPGDSNTPNTDVREHNGREFGFNPLVKQVVKGVWIASVLVEIRSIYRIIEFVMGVDGYLFRHEWTLWVFEAAPTWVALLVLGYFHPVKWLQQKRRSAFVDKHNHKVNGRLPR